MAFTFSAPTPAQNEGDLAGLECVISSAVGRMLKDDKRPRPEIAGAVSALLCENVSKFMLDAYASEGRADHAISAARFLALVAATKRFDILHAVLTKIGASVLVGEEVHAARLGHLMAKRAEIDAQIKEIRPITAPIERGAR